LKSTIARPTTPAWLWNERLDEGPFGIGEVGFVTQLVAAMLSPSGRRPHRGSREGFDIPSESRPP
jgi:hypothetical protein